MHNYLTMKTMSQKSNVFSVMHYFILIAKNVGLQPKHDYRER